MALGRFHGLTMRICLAAINHCANIRRPNWPKGLCCRKAIFFRSFRCGFSGHQKPSFIAALSRLRGGQSFFGTILLKFPWREPDRRESSVAPGWVSPGAQAARQRRRRELPRVWVSGCPAGSANARRWRQRPFRQQDFEFLRRLGLAQDEFRQHAMPTPAIRLGNIASPLLTRSGPAGRTVAVSPFLPRKRQTSCADCEE